MAPLEGERLARAKAVQVAALQRLIETSDDKHRRVFLMEFQFHLRLGIRPIESESIDDLHFALYEEWHLIRTRTPWLFGGGDASSSSSSSKNRKVMCCHFKKSTEQRPLLEAECRRKGLEYTPKTNRFQLAELLLPGLPGHCEKHLPGTTSSRKRRKQQRRPEDDDESRNAVFFRGTLSAKKTTRLLRLRGTWSSVDAGWHDKHESQEGFLFYTHEDPWTTTADDVRFYGYFKLGRERGVPERDLRITFHNDDTKGDEAKVILITGSGDNEFGRFDMTGRVENKRKVFLTRHYTEVYEPSGENQPQPEPSETTKTQLDDDDDDDDKDTNTNTPTKRKRRGSRPPATPPTAQATP